MNKERPMRFPPFHSEMTRGETIIALAYIPVHIVLMPILLSALMEQGLLTIAQANILSYGIGLVYMVALLFKFLRREFDPLCDNLFRNALDILGSYGLMFVMNIGVGMLLLAFGPIENQNNDAVVELAKTDYGSIEAMVVFMAPVIEELMFRAGLFGVLYRRNRVAAYAVSMLAFSIYHVWSFAVAQPRYWIYVIQYLPVSFLLCRLYERSSSIWTSIFFHMIVNAVSINALLALESLL